MLEIIQKQMIKKTHIISIITIVAFLGIGATWVITKATNSTQVLPEIIKEVPELVWSVTMVSYLQKIACIIRLLF